MLYGWMKSIIVYLILSGVVVNLAPGANYRKYIKFFTGLMLVMLVAEQISFCFGIGEADIDMAVEQVDYYIENSKGSYNSEAGMEQGTDSYYSLSVEEGIKGELLKQGLVDVEVEAIMDKDYHILRCTVYCNMENMDKASIKNIISNVYNMELDNIYIVSR